MKTDYGKTKSNMSEEMVNELKSMLPQSPCTKCSNVMELIFAELQKGKGIVRGKVYCSDCEKVFNATFAGVK